MKQQQFIRKKKEMQQQVNSGMKAKTRLKWSRKAKRPVRRKKEDDISSHDFNTRRKNRTYAKI